MKALIFVVTLLSCYSLIASDETPACEQSKELFAEQLKIGMQCKEEYQLYCYSRSGSDRSCSRHPSSFRRTEELKIAGFNVFNLGKEPNFQGSRETIFKSNKLLALVINEFDLVSAIELKHFASSDFKSNNKITDSLEKAREGKIWKRNKDDERVEVSERELKTAYMIPPYLLVLKELHELDRSWRLILSPDLYSRNPEDTLNNELAGFFYRASKVKPVEDSYCEGIACVVPTNEFEAEVARKPFIGRFQSGERQFSFVGIHVRYREPTLPRSKDLDEEIFNKMMEVYDPREYSGYDFNEEESARFSEVASVANFLAAYQQDTEYEDVLLFGDFNLPTGEDIARPSKKQRAYKKSWEGALDALPGAKAFISELTTVGQKTLTNSFDHFVYNPKSPFLSNCETKKTNVFNFTDEDVFPAGKEYIDALREDPESSTEEFVSFSKNTEPFKEID